jgi:hypothetical protein
VPRGPKKQRFLEWSSSVIDWDHAHTRLFELIAEEGNMQEILFAREEATLAENRGSEGSWAVCTSMLPARKLIKKARDARP